jgi:RNA recognition motif-containing protein
VLLENLDVALTEEDIEDIFQDLGRCSVMVYYDRGGRSTGKAEVTFSRGSDAYQAVKEYDEAEVNGQQMRVKLVGGAERRGVDVRKAAPERAARAKACFVCGGEGHIAKDCPSGKEMKDDACYNCGKEGHQRRNCPQLEGKDAAPAKGACFTCGKTGHRAANCPQGGAKEPRTKGKGRKGREEKKPATQEDLDADMDAYFKQKDAAAAAKAAPATEEVAAPAE